MSRNTVYSLVLYHCLIDNVAGTWDSFTHDFAHDLYTSTPYTYAIYATSPSAALGDPVVVGCVVLKTTILKTDAAFDALIHETFDSIPAFSNRKNSQIQYHTEVMELIGDPLDHEDFDYIVRNQYLARSTGGRA